MRHPNQPETIYVSHKSRHNSSVVRVGIGAFVLIGFLALIMPFYTLILFGVVAGPAGVYIGVLALVKGANGAVILLLKWQDYQMAKAKIAQAQNNALIIVTPTGTYISPEMKDWGFVPRTYAERKQQQNLLPATVPAQLTPLLDEIPHTHALFFGATGSGKTSGCIRWAATIPGKKWVIDPNAALNEWPSDCKVTSEIDKIESVASAFVQVMREQIAKGKKRDGVATLIIDEPAYLRDVEGIDLYKKIIRIASIGRQWGFYVAWTSQATTLAETGFNAASLLNNFIIAKFTGRSGRGHRAFILDGNKNEIEYQPPEPVVLDVPSDKLLEAHRMILAGDSWNNATRLMGYGQGGNEIKRLKKEFDSCGLSTRKEN